MNLIKSDYGGHAISFNESGWFNATAVATRFGKRPVDWLALDSTKEYIVTLSEVSNCEKSSLLKTKRGRHNGGTWFHPSVPCKWNGKAFSARWWKTQETGGNEMTNHEISRMVEDLFWLGVDEETISIFVRVAIDERRTAAA